jgi:uncharacterized protein YjbI with pentapeptide repeats
VASRDRVPQDLAGARFERVNLRDATFSRVVLAGGDMYDEHRLYAERDLTELEKGN